MFWLTWSRVFLFWDGESFHSCQPSCDIIICRKHAISELPLTSLSEWGHVLSLLWKLFSFLCKYTSFSLVCSRLLDSTVGMMQKWRTIKKKLWAHDLVKEKCGGALPLHSFFTFYFCVGAFSISQTRLSRRKKQAGVAGKRKWPIEGYWKSEVVHWERIQAYKVTVLPILPLYSVHPSLYLWLVWKLVLCLKTYLLIFKGVFPVLLHVYHSL